MTKNPQKTTIKAVTAEFLCTFIYIFSICANMLSMSANDNAGNVTNMALCTGFTAIAIIFAFGTLSGAHFNPAVTLGAIIGRKIDPILGIIYIVTQLFASILAVFCLYGFYDDVSGLTFEVPSDGGIKATMMEMILTFILVFIYFATSFKFYKQKLTEPSSSEMEEIGTPSGSLLHKSLETSPNNNSISDVEDQNSSIELQENQKEIDNARLALCPISIGLTLGFLCFLDGGFSGGFFNPARAFGPAVVNSIVGGTSSWNSFLYYVVGDFGGAALAALLYSTLFQ